MKEKLFNLASKAAAVFVTYKNEGGFRANVATSPITGDPSSQVVHLNWRDSSDVACYAVFNEENLTEALVDEESALFNLTDAEGDEVSLLFFSEDGLLTLTDADPNMYLVVQEGGSSSEAYVHIHDQIENAFKDRESCADSGYRTSEPIACPESLVKHPAFFLVAEQLVKSTFNFDYPSQ